MKLFRNFLMLFVFIAVASCIPDDERTCQYSEYARTTSVTGPETIIVNQEATFNVTFRVENSCGSFLNFAVSEGFPKQVAAIAYYEGCDCGQSASTLTREYKFTPTQTGEFEFRFYTGTTTFITKTLTVTEE